MTVKPKNTIYFGDSRKLESLLESDSVDLVLTGPPYWTEVIYSQDPAQLSKIEDYQTFLTELGNVWSSCQTALKDGGIMAVWVHDFFRADGSLKKYIPFHSDILKTMPGQLTLINMIIWDRYLTRNRGELAGSGPLGTAVQYILIFQKSGSHPNNADIIRKSLLESIWNPVWHKKVHPKLFGSRAIFRLLFNLKKHLPIFSKLEKIAGKRFQTDEYKFRNYVTECPPEVAERLIRDYTKPGDTVLDPFLGSGTTAKAASLLGRNAIGFEINKDALGAIKLKLGDNFETIMAE